MSKLIYPPQDEQPAYLITWPGMEMVERPASDFVEVPGMGLMSKELAAQYDEYLLDPESKSLRAWEDNP